jgi:dihydrodipicolinate synthase/N-acetylneuraminate lyase
VFNSVQPNGLERNCRSQFRNSGLSLTCHAQLSGALTVVVSAPYYFPAAQSEQLDDLEDLSQVSDY